MLCTCNVATSNTSSTLVSGSVFSLQVNHGTAPSGGSYAYAILPGASGSSVAAYAAAPAVRILANTRTLQAARHDGLALTQAAFYASGTLSTGSGATLTVREPSLVMLDESTAATKLSVSNPNGLATTIHADVSRTRPEGPDEFTRVTLRLSGSDQGGATVSRTFDQPAVRTFTYQLRDGAAAVAPLVYQWSFEGATAGERLQNSGTGANATLQAVAYGSEGSTAKIAYGLGVDETTTAMSPQRLGRLSANAGGALLTTSGTVVIPTAFTVEALVRPDLMETGGSIGYAVMAGGAATNNRGYFVISQEGAATDSTSTIIGDSLSQADNVGRTIAAFVPGHWYYVANTYTVSSSQTTINSYVADLTAGQMSVTQAVANQVASGRPLTAAQMAIGGYFASGTAQEAWSGSIDEVSLFGRVLTAAEVQGRLDKLYQAPTLVSWSAAASGTALGGSGTWSALGKRWVSGTTRLLPVTTARLVFGGSAGTVAVTGSHAVGGGIAFTTDGYTLTGGTLSFTGDQAANMVNVLAGDSATLAATISGTGGMTKTGAGMLTLTGTNSYAGTTTVADGILTITSTAALPGYASAGRVSVADGGTLAVTNAVADAAVASILGTGNLAPGATFGFDTAAGNRTYPSALSGSFGVVKLGTNTLTLSGSQSYTGPTTISGGTLAFTFGRNQTLAGPITGPGSLAKSGSGALLLTASSSHAGGTLITGGTLQIGAGGTTGWISGAVSNDGALAFHRSDDVVFSDGISGSGSVVQAGGGRLTLSGSNAYAGGTLITGTGSLAVAAAAALGSGTITLRTDQASFNPVLVLTSGMTLPNPIVLAQTAANRNNIRTAGTTTLGGPITITGTGVGSNVFQNDASGQLTIAGDLSAPASYSGALSFRYGRILITGTINAPSATFNLNNGGTTIVSSTGNTWASVSFSGASTANLLQLGAHNALATDAAVAFNPDSSGGGIDMNGFNQTLPGFYNATGTNPAPLNRIFNDGGSNATLTLAGLTANRWSNVALADGTGGGTLAFVMNSAGRMQTLASATSSYTGGTTIVAGTLALGHANALGGGGRLAVNGGTLDLAGSSPTVGALSGSSGGLITSGSAGASAVLTVSSAVNSTFAGRIQNGVGTVGLVKTGAGSLTLTGSNTYTGPTFVSAGTLAIFGNQSAATGAVTVASGAALGGTGTVGGATTIQSG
ncbi:MAG: autotransporter-associated beta strand repeat-containing protein, partial [Planctomycetia bacterium]